MQATVTAGDLLIDATGFGGPGSPAGSGEGGEARLSASDGTLTANAVTMIADGSTVGGVVRIVSEGFGGSGTGSIDLASLVATTNGGAAAGDILIDVLAGSWLDLGIAALTSNSGGTPGAGEDGIEIGSEGMFTADSLTMTTTDGIRIGTANGGTIDVFGLMQGNSASLIRVLDDGSGGAIAAITLDLNGADIQFTQMVSADDILLTLPGDYAINSVFAAGNSLTINAGGTITATQPLSYDSSVSLNAGTDLFIDDLSALGAIGLTAGGNLGTGDLTAGTTIVALAGGNLAVGAVTAGESISLTSGGNLDAASLDAPSISLALAGDFVVGDLTADDSLSILAGGNLTAGNLIVGGDLSLEAGLDLVTLDLDAGGLLTLVAAGSITAGNLTSAGAMSLTSGAGQAAPTPHTDDRAPQGDSDPDHGTTGDFGGPARGVPTK